MAPEVVKETPYSEQVDIYSFGIILWQLVSGGVPFSQMSKKQFMETVVIAGERPRLMYASNMLPLPEDVCDLLRVCWAEDPWSRPGSLKLLQWVSKLADEAPVAKGCCF